MKIKEELKDLRGKSVKELSAELAKTYTSLKELRFSSSFRKLKDTSKISKTRLRISRIWTILGEKALDEK